MAKEEATLLLRIKSVGSNVLNKTKRALGGIAKAAGLAGVAIVGFVGASIGKFKIQEAAINSLNQSLLNQGIFTKKLSQEYQTMASELQKVTTFGDEAIISAQAQIQNYIGQEKVTKELTKSILDFATAQKIDLKSAADLVGKSIGSSTNALTRYGISIDSTATPAEKLIQVQEALNQKFGGQAEAAAKGLGALDQLSNSFGDLMEVIGGQVAPIVADIARRLTSFTDDLQKNKSALSALTDTFFLVIQAGTLFKNLIVGIGEVIGSVLGTAFGALSQALAGDFALALETIKSSAGDIVDEIKARHATTMEELAANEKSFYTKRKTNRVDDLKDQKLNDKNRTKHEKLLAATKTKNDEKLAKKEEAAKKKKADLDKVEREALISNAQTVFGQISTLQDAQSKKLIILGKAAAIANITISTARGVMAAFAMGPILGPILAPIVFAAGVVQAGKVAGVSLQEGGIVRARPGGILAQIGEGGQDEAVIPLDEAGGVLGTTINIAFNGPVLGDEEQARQFALVIDAELLKLRQDNESLAFDEGII